ncbi:hypothetical protein CTAYLR_004164 [Chrysophaeum taylorii]|uniref:Uncharacterized protein n=1 Tax=Chrysophaeum taylorii TaxID=2483200 RepID=A0AAD7UL46_9STRA|nr:hypothetical protein CTAYLR_004164 [Chrysophaeum taylorii]
MVLRGVVFDMDGTLTVSKLDLKEMYRRAGVAADEDILEAVKSMPAARASWVRGVIEELEEEGRRTLALMPGARDVGLWLARHNLQCGLVTRNSRRTVEHAEATLWRDLSFSPAISRDDQYPPKPDPAALVAIAEAWGCDPSEIVMVGDSVSNDVAFGERAGARTVLLGTGKADVVIESLVDLPRMLWERFEIPGPLGTAAPLLKVQRPVPDSHPACAAAASGDVAAALAGLDARDDYGQTPLHWAVEAGNPDLVRTLVEAGADVDAKGYVGATPVSRAARNGDVAVLRTLLDLGAAVDEPNDKMQAPLHFAAFKRHRPAVHLLLDRGASTTVLDRKGRTPAEDTACPDIRADILNARAGFRVKEDPCSS